MALQQDMTFIIAGLSLPKGFFVCELGAQGMVGVTKDEPARDWYLERGCGRYESIDGNGRGTLTADLNLPLALNVERYRTRFKDAFDLVTDLGTGEHIFDQAQVWRTLHDLVKAGGYIVFDRPTGDFHKHCFYLINECLVRDLAAANGYAIEWLDTKPMPRGGLIRGVFRVPATKVPFRVPQQGKYKPDLVIA